MRRLMGFVIDESNEEDKHKSPTIASINNLQNPLSKFIKHLQQFMESAKT